MESFTPIGNPAPVVLFVYNRPYHTMQTIGALQRNVLASETPLFVFSDAPVDELDSKAVALVRELVRESTGFASVEIICREQHLGLAKSVISGVTEVISRFGRVIVLEDDVICAAQFLRYMNEALDYYQHEPQVFSITGYNLSPAAFTVPRGYAHQVYFNPRFCSWGWATWKDRWKKADWEMRQYSRIMADAKLRRRYEQSGKDKTRLLQLQHQGKIDSWAIRWDLTHFMHNAVCVYPVRSLVDNIGLDGMGTHEAWDRRFRNELDDQQYVRLHQPVMVNNRIIRRFARFYAPPRFAKLRKKLRPSFKQMQLTVERVLTKTLYAPLAHWYFQNKLLPMIKVMDSDRTVKGASKEKPQRFLTINTIAGKGGASKIAYMVHRGLQQRQRQSTFLTAFNYTNDSSVHSLSRPKDIRYRALRTYQRHTGWLDVFELGSLRIPQLTEFQQCDLVHLHNIHGGYLSPFVLPVLATKPLVWTLQDEFAITGHCGYTLDCTRFEIGCGNCPRLEVYPSIPDDTTHFLWALKKRIYSHLTPTLVVPSRWLEKQVQRSILSHCQCYFIPNSIDQQVFAPTDKTRARAMLRLPQDKKILLYSADWGKKNDWKGGQTVTQVEEYFRSDSDVLCVILGGERGVRQQHLIEVPYIYDEKLLALYYAAADVFLYPIQADNCPLGVIEVLSCGTPVVTYGVGGVPELVHHRENGFVAEKDNLEQFIQGVKWLLKPENNRYCSKQARPSVHHLNLKAMVAAYLNLFEQVYSEWHREHTDV